MKATNTDIYNEFMRMLIDELPFTKLNDVLYGNNLHYITRKAVKKYLIKRRFDK